MAGSAVAVVRRHRSLLASRRVGRAGEEGWEAEEVVGSAVVVEAAGWVEGKEVLEAVVGLVEAGGTAAEKGVEVVTEDWEEAMALMGVAMD